MKINIIKYIHRVSLLLLGLLAPFTYSKVIIFDLGYTLVEPSKSAFIHEIGLGNIIGYYINDGDENDLKNTIYDILEAIPTPPAASVIPAYDTSGRKLPPIMCLLFAGHISPHEVLDKAYAMIEKLDAHHYFNNKREKRVITNTIRTMFSPDILAAGMRPIKKMVNLMQECAESYDKYGNKNIVMLGSNWDPVSFELVYNDDCYDDIFDYIAPENIIVSGNIHLVKPNSTFFEYVIHTYQLDPSECIFIDDQPENVDAAIDCGMCGIWVDRESPNYKDIKKTLAVLGACA